MCSCVCVSACICVFTSIHREGFIFLGLEFEGQINDVVSGKGVFSSAKFHHCYFSMKHRAFLNGRFIMFTHQKRAKLDLTFKLWGLQLPLSDIRFVPRYIVSCSASCVSTHERGCILTRKYQNCYEFQYWIQPLTKYLRRSVFSNLT